MNYLMSGSGKSYTMMGNVDNKGIIPRLCDALFDRIAKKQSTELAFKVEVSYMEIYNEKVITLCIVYMTFFQYNLMGVYRVYVIIG